MVMKGGKVKGCILTNIRQVLVAVSQLLSPNNITFTLPFHFYLKKVKRRVKRYIRLLCREYMEEYFHRGKVL